MFKRTLQLVAVTAALGVSITACASGGSVAEADGTVTVFHRWTGPAGDAIAMVFDQCEKDLDLTIDVTNISSEEYEVQLPVSLSSSAPPDIYALWPGGRPVFQAQNGLIAPITEFYNDSIAPIYSEGVNGGVVETDGEVYVMPINVMPNSFYYRIDIFDKYGLQPPATWDEFTDVLETLKDNGEVPIALGSGSGWEPLFWFDYMVLRTAGSEFREDLMWGKADYTDPSVVEAMKMWGELIEDGYFNPNITSLSFDDMLPAVGNGSAAMMLMGTWAIDGLTAAGLTPGEDFGSFPFPTIDPNVASATEGAMEGWATTAGRDNAEDVHAVLECFASAEQLTAYAEAFPTLTPNPDADPEFPAETADLLNQLAELNEATFHENLELATVPPVTDVAKREIPRFLEHPDQYMQVLEALQAASEAEFAK